MAKGQRRSPEVLAEIYIPQGSKELVPRFFSHTSTMTLKMSSVPMDFCHRLYTLEYDFLSQFF